MKKPLLLFLLSATGFLAANAQTSPDTASKNTLNNSPEVEAQAMKPRQKIKPFGSRTLHNLAAEQIKQLKNGVLLVRLRTSENAIKNLGRTGNYQMAATLERQQHAENQRLVYAFTNQFTFCPVYFFYSSDTEKVKKGQTSGYFLNKDLKPDKSIALPDTNFFVVELTDLEQFREDPDSPDASNNAEVTFKALVLRDRKFHQLKKPFPFYIKAASNFPPRKRSEAEMADLLNARLNAFYKEVTLGKARTR